MLALIGRNCAQCVIKGFNQVFLSAGKCGQSCNNSVTRPDTRIIVNIDWRCDEACMCDATPYQCKRLLVRFYVGFLLLHNRSLVICGFLHLILSQATTWERDKVGTRSYKDREPSYQTDYRH